MIAKSVHPAPTRIFVGGPFTAALSCRSDFHQEVQTRLKTLLDVVKRDNRSYFSSHEAELWGEDLEKPGDLLVRDLRELEQSSHLIAYVCNVHSFGTTVEVGYALCLGLPVLIVYEPGSRPESDFYQGLVDTGRITEFEWSDEARTAEVILRFISVPGTTHQRFLRGAMNQHPLEAEKISSTPTGCAADRGSYGAG